jgi:CelD/BcsL family acetyltransferase involved in cellulose biosynthesis/predicted ATP-grasp superfamily ATP-dependent carboligase
VTRATPLAAFRTAVPPADVAPDGLSRLTDLSREFAPDLSLAIYTDLDAVEDEWRSFEHVAECTAFQTFEWLATWQRHIGAREDAVPIVVIGRFADGRTAFILPLAVDIRRSTRRLCWLGQDLCDYNAPLLARDFAQRVTADRFVALWRELLERLQSDPTLRFDWIDFEKMPQTVGVQSNPFVDLRVMPNANSAHITQLGDDWETFYRAKRSSATRRRDRAKRKRMSEFGEICFATAAEADDLRRILDTLWEQKKQIFAHKGIADIFARPGYREFFADFASNPNSRHMAHVSSVQIGSTCAAANFAIVFGDCYYHVLSSYCESELTRYGPGTLHLRELLAYAIGRGLRLFDFTIGDERYKLEWSDLRLKLYDYSAAATWRGWPSNFASIARRRVKRFVKQTPLVWHWVSRLRSAVGPLLHAQAPGPTAAAAIGEAKSRPAHACIMGDMDLLRPIAAAGIPCSVVARPGAPSLYSRFTRARLHWDCSSDAETFADVLVRFGQAQNERPVLFYEEDEQLLFISRHRERLAQAFRFVIADAPLVEDLLDKGRFAGLAKRHGLPAPATLQFHPASAEPTGFGFEFPIVIKPLNRGDRWNEIFGLRKALAAENPDALRQLWPQLQNANVDLLAQQLIPGAEAQIESYHCYIDARGGVAADFTGRKIRTYPVAYGHTTALEITDAADVRRQGRIAVERLGLTGVAKLDFKRDEAGRLHLLEINPRFTLWHHAGAVAGVNIPALVYADLTGTPRPHVTRVKAGVRWCRVWKDFPAARQSRVPLTTWLPWALGCEAKSSLSWNDPLPVVKAALHLAAARLRGRDSQPSQAGRDGVGP